MNIDSGLCYELANLVSNWKTPLAFEKEICAWRHQAILNGLDTIEAFFRSIAQMSEETEQSLMLSVPFLSPPDKGVSHSVSIQPSGKTSSKTKGLNWNEEVSYALASAEKAWSTSWTAAAASVGALCAKAEGKAAVQILKSGKFDPKVDLQGSLQASLAAAQASGRIGHSSVYAHASAQGEVGTIYAEAKADLSKEGIDLEASVGAAALRGSCTIGFSLFGIGIALSAEGSLLSSEASISYRHKNREWEVGSKLGFIAGLGFKLKVTY